MQGEENMKRISAILISLLLFSMLLTQSSGAGSLKPPTKFEGSLWKSVMVLYGKLDDYKTICTIEPYEKIPGGYNLLTAGHCVQEVPVDLAFTVADEVGGKETPVTLIKAYDGDGMDFAIFEMKTTKVYPVMKLGDEHGSRVGDWVVSPNFADGLGKQLSSGRITSDSLIATEDCSVHDGCPGDFLVQLFGAPGMSGAAVISEKTHKVVGIIVAQWGGNVGMEVMPISAFKTFLTAPAQKHPDEIREPAVTTIILN